MTSLTNSATFLRPVSACVCGEKQQVPLSVEAPHLCFKHWSIRPLFSFKLHNIFPASKPFQKKPHLLAYAGDLRASPASPPSDAGASGLSPQSEGCQGPLFLLFKERFHLCFEKTIGLESHQSMDTVSPLSFLG